MSLALTCKKGQMLTGETITILSENYDLQDLYGNFF